MYAKATPIGTVIVADEGDKPVDILTKAREEGAMVYDGVETRYRVAKSREPDRVKEFTTRTIHLL